MKKTLIALSFTALLVGCANDPVSDTTAPIVDGSGKSTSGTQTGVDTGSMKGNPLTDPKHPLYQSLQARSIFFDYNSDAIKPEYMPVVENHSRYLRDNPGQKVLVQGNTDDRGSREYNLALGQRRADAIKSRMTLLGARTTQVESVSLGEEKPRCSDASEACYGENRRGDLAY